MKVGDILESKTDKGHNIYAIVEYIDGSSIPTHINITKITNFGIQRGYPSYEIWWEQLDNLKRKEFDAHLEKLGYYYEDGKLKLSHIIDLKILQERLLLFLNDPGNFSKEEKEILIQGVKNLVP